MGLSELPLWLDKIASSSEYVKTHPVSVVRTCSRRIRDCLWLEAFAAPDTYVCRWLNSAEISVTSESTLFARLGASPTIEVINLEIAAPAPRSPTIEAATESGSIDADLG